MSESIKWQELTPEQRDILIVEKVLGYNASQVRGHIAIPCYTQQIEAAWLLVGHLKTHYDVHVATNLSRYDAAIMDRRFGGKQFEASAASAQEAICIAALRACGFEVVV